MTEHEQITQAIAAVNSAWLQGDTAALGLYFLDDVVVALPGSLERVAGKEQCVASYAAFIEHATVEDFTAGTPVVDLLADDVAVASTPFRIVYTIDGRSHHEGGHDLMVLRRAGGAWRIAWRTVLAAEDEA
jgi:uncharacterized protein (TIGR02246 family)